MICNFTCTRINKFCQQFKIKTFIRQNYAYGFLIILNHGKLMENLILYLRVIISRIPNIIKHQRK